MRKYKELDLSDPVKFQEGKKHVTIYQLSSRQENKFHHNAQITTGSKNS